MELKALLLDLDGTLINTAPDMVGALNRLLLRHGSPASDAEETAKKVSQGAKALIHHGFGDDIGSAKTDQLVSEFLQDYENHVADQSHLYEGMPEILDYCEAVGIKWGVITNKPIHLAKELMDQLGYLNRSAILLGGDSLPVKKPDPVPMLHSCMVLNLAPSQCLYVGDHHRDVQAGNAAGMDTAAALWGYIPENEDPHTWDANYLINKPSGLLQLVKETLNTA